MDGKIKEVSFSEWFFCFVLSIALPFILTSFLKVFDLYLIFIIFLSALLIRCGEGLFKRTLIQKISFSTLSLGCPIYFNLVSTKPSALVIGITALLLLLTQSLFSPKFYRFALGLNFSGAFLCAGGRSFFYNAPFFIDEALLIILFLNFLISFFVTTKRNNFHTKHQKNLESLSLSLAHELNTYFATCYLELENEPTSLPVIKKNIEDASLCLDMLKAYFAKGKLNRDHFNIKESIEAAKLCFESKDQEIVSIHGEGFSLTADFRLIKHVFLNFLKNAIFSIKKAGRGRIEIRLEKGRYMNTIWIKDTGTGIPSSIQHKIFEPFFSTAPYNMGMGLPFCKEVIKKSGGDLSVTSQEGVFTEFCLTLPCDYH